MAIDAILGQWKLVSRRRIVHEVLIILIIGQSSALVLTIRVRRRLSPALPIKTRRKSILVPSKKIGVGVTPDAHVRPSVFSSVLVAPPITSLRRVLRLGIHVLSRGGKHPSALLLTWRVERFFAFLTFLVLCPLS